jgi:DNA end-binding protein Ku
MAQGIWKGDINFGLVYIPVTLYTAESHQCDVKLRLLDKRDLSPVGFEKINKNTGKKVPSEYIVEGYEYEEGAYVLLTKEDLKKVHPLSNQSVEILEFVDAAEISPQYFEKPYYLVPQKRGQRGYALLREVMRKNKKIGIAKVIIRTREYLAALMVKDQALMLELLRFPCELVDAKKFEFPDKELTASLKKKEIQIAEELVNSMSTQWKPSKYENEYQGSLLDFIAKKVKAGESYSPKEVKEEVQEKRSGKVIDIMDLLKKSVEKAKHKPASAKKRAGKKK